MKVSYIDHSGVSIEFKDRILFFDYVKGKANLPLDKKIYFFVSHHHQDHYNEKIFTLPHPHLNIILSDDIDHSLGLKVKAHQDMMIDDMHVMCLKSTDEGVAFIVEVCGKRIFFAGDYHAWLWEIENDEDQMWTDQMMDLYQQEFELLKKYHYDMIFYPVDFRLKENTYYGLDKILDEVSFDYLMPIHFWNDMHLLEETNKKDSRILNLLENKEFKL
ncbi:MAG: MBL fold metallo-hydrolase [Erysipelotrichaceae bacterium]